MKKTQEEIQIKISDKVSELRIALVKQDRVTQMILENHRRFVEKVDQKKINEIQLNTYTRDNGNGNEFENLVNEISNLFREFRELE